ncbi:hypothetical protein M514_03654 [Trichuris suis]|uniref:Uncharacterized protein n=1 Tax=Trichuris suis TaxID=68888 RepID=A0A085MEF6_9BILA|nr:hypothetical protein M513_03654 [Trichuris suis]KFD62864.1 hypothetical protein M514_03654 [Trichuris suis]
MYRTVQYIMQFEIGQLNSMQEQVRTENRLYESVMQPCASRMPQDFADIEIDRLAVHLAMDFKMVITKQCICFKASKVPGLHNIGPAGEAASSVTASVGIRWWSSNVVKRTAVGRKRRPSVPARSFAINDALFRCPTWTLHDNEL